MSLCSFLGHLLRGCEAWCTLWSCWPASTLIDFRSWCTAVGFSLLPPRWCWQERYWWPFSNVLTERWCCYPLMVWPRVGWLQCSLCWPNDNGVHHSYVYQSVTFLLSFFSYGSPFMRLGVVFHLLFRWGSGSIACSFDSRISFNEDSDAWYKSWLFIHAQKGQAPWRPKYARCLIIEQTRQWLAP